MFDRYKPGDFGNVVVNDDVIFGCLKLLFFNDGFDLLKEICFGEKEFHV